MFPSLSLLALLGAASLSSAATTTTGTCTTATSTANFNHIPTGTLSPTRPYRGLLYSGWEVVSKKSTPFTSTPHSRHFLQMTGDNATITAANGMYYNDPGTPSNPSYYFGCSKEGVSYDCEFVKDYSVPGQAAEDTTYYGYFNSTEYPKKLEEAGALEPINVQEVFWKITAATGNPAGKELKLYLDKYVYYITNCMN